MKKLIFFFSAAVLNAGIIGQASAQLNDRRDNYPPVKPREQKRNALSIAIPADMDSTCAYYRYVEQLRKNPGVIPKMLPDQPFLQNPVVRPRPDNNAIQRIR